MSKQQTAVELFAIALYEGGYLQGNGDEIQQLLENHLQIQKKHIIKAIKLTIENEYYQKTYANCGSLDNMSEQYYNETYGGNK
jgi:hypothetical protein